MKLQFSQRVPFLAKSTVTLEPRREGLAITSRGVSRIFPDVSATLILRWAELFLMIGLLVIGGLVIHYRYELAATSLISTWAPAHLRISVAVLTAIAFFLGLFFALWKKQQLFTYSIAEISFALFTIFQIGLHLWPQGRLADFVALGSALYVVSRGFGNLWDAFINETEIERLHLQYGQQVLVSQPAMPVAEAAAQVAQPAEPGSQPTELGD